MHQLNITRQFALSVEQLFNAWRDPNKVRQWFAPGELVVPELNIDFREGGSFRIVMLDEQTKNTHTATGCYQSIKENESLQFSWQWENSPNVTQVKLSFKSIDDTHSELELIHSEFNTEEDRDNHNRGWNACLVKL